jgi:hypothetical protein
VLAALDAFGFGYAGAYAYIYIRGLINTGIEVSPPNHAAHFSLGVIGESEGYEGKRARDLF